MHKKLLISSLLIMLLLTSIVLTAFGGGYNGNGHWAQVYVEKLEESYDLGSLEKENLNDTISMEQFEGLVREVLDSEYHVNLQAMTREEVVSELVELWSKEVGRDLRKIAMPKILVYRDTEAISFRYQHNVMVAYFHDIAKGRGEGLFNPKELVTYGEAIVLITRVKDAIVEEKTKGLIADATYNKEEDKIAFDFKLINQYPETKEIMFSSGQQYEITIVDEDNKEVYRYSDDKFFTMALIMKSIETGEALEWQEIWDFTDKEGNQLTTGSFKATIEILCMDEAMERIDVAVEVAFEL